MARCTAHNKQRSKKHPPRRCKNRSVTGAPHCYAHLERRRPLAPIERILPNLVPVLRLVAANTTAPDWRSLGATSSYLRNNLYPPRSRHNPYPNDRGCDNRPALLINGQIHRERCPYGSTRAETKVCRGPHMRVMGNEIVPPGPGHRIHKICLPCRVDTEERMNIGRPDYRRLETSPPRPPHANMHADLWLCRRCSMSGPIRRKPMCDCLPPKRPEGWPVCCDQCAFFVRRSEIQHCIQYLRTQQPGVHEPYRTLANSLLPVERQLEWWINSDFTGLADNGHPLPPAQHGQGRNYCCCGRNWQEILQTYNNSPARRPFGKNWDSLIRLCLHCRGKRLWEVSTIP